MAKAVTDLLYLPRLQLPNLRDIEQRLTDVLHFRPEGPHEIRISGQLRERLFDDVRSIEVALETELDDLRAVLADSAVGRHFKNAMLPRIDAVEADQRRVEEAAPGLIELITHRTHHFFENARYETVKDWLGRHRITDDHYRAIIVFGDEKLVRDVHEVQPWRVALADF